MTSNRQSRLDAPAAFRAARHTLGLSQADLALVLGYGSKSRVSEVERGERTPDACKLRLLRAYLDGYRPDDWPAKVSTPPSKVSTRCE